MNMIQLFKHAYYFNMYKMFDCLLELQRAIYFYIFCQHKISSKHVIYSPTCLVVM